jgi:hypothetical protein
MSTEAQSARAGYRAPEDDFFCEKYEVWYPRSDCNYRVLHATYEGCSGCFQGRVNLRWIRPESRGATGATDNLIPFPTSPAPRERGEGEAESAPQEV